MLTTRNKTVQNFNSFGGSLTFNYRQLPYISISYQPITQTMRNDIDTLYNQLSFSTLSGQMGYQYIIKNLVFNSFVGLIKQYENNSYNEFRTKSTMLFANQTVKFSKSFLVNLYAGYTQMHYKGALTSLKNLDVSAMYSFKKKNVITSGCSFINYKLAERETMKSSQYLSYTYLINSSNRLDLRCSHININTKDQITPGQLDIFDFFVKYTLTIL